MNVVVHDSTNHVKVTILIDITLALLHSFELHFLISHLLLELSGHV